MTKLAFEVATPASQLTLGLTNLGWELQSINFTGGEYVAKAKSSQTGQQVARTGDSPEVALAAVYQHALRATEVRRKMVSAWQGNWYPQLHEIAKTYADLSPYESKAAEYWQALALENRVHVVAIKAQIRIEYSKHPQPYESPREMQEAVHHKGKLEVSTVETNHPMWAQEDVVNCRICHDVLGICHSGGGWSWPGANNATAHHMPHLSPEAQEALFVEVIGRTAYETVYRGLGTPRVALMSEFLHPVQETEGVHVAI